VSFDPDLAPLAEIARQVAAEWELELGPAFSMSRFSYAAPAGDDSVLKVLLLEDDESDHDADALALWAGDGAVRLLRHDRERRVFLMERVRPGTDISKLPEDEATAIAVDVGLRLWKPAAKPFRWIGDHVPRWLDNAERTPGEWNELIPLARELYASLEVGRSTLVHGDFHHHNILDGGDRGYLAIDSKAMLGEPEFDVWSFLRNPLWYQMTPAVTERRIAAFAAAGLDETRIRVWAVIRGAFLVGADAAEVPVLRGLLG
jgi:streptomycin 6-kinase